MTSPARQQKPDPEKRHVIVTDFIAAYGDAIRAVEKSAEITGTEAWLTLYEDHRKAERRARAEVSAAVVKYGEMLAKYVWGEDAEKAVKDLLKQAVEGREAEDHWKRQTLDPIRRPVRACEEIWNEFKRKGDDLAASTPLFGKGVVVDLRNAYHKFDSVGFDEVTGRVTFGKKSD